RPEATRDDRGKALVAFGSPRSLASRADHCDGRRGAGDGRAHARNGVAAGPVGRRRRGRGRTRLTGPARGRHGAGGLRDGCEPSFRNPPARLARSRRGERMIRGIWNRDTVALIFLASALPVAIAWPSAEGLAGAWRLFFPIVLGGL